MADRVPGADPSIVIDMTTELDPERWMPMFIVDEFQKLYPDIELPKQWMVYGSMLMLTLLGELFADWENHNLDDASAWGCPTIIDISQMGSVGPNYAACGFAFIFFTIFAATFTYIFSWITSLLFAPVVLIGLIIPNRLYHNTFIGEIVKGFTAWTFPILYGVAFPNWI